jgi:ligand-binding sensor domain-containing protein
MIARSLLLAAALVSLTAEASPPASKVLTNLDDVRACELLDGGRVALGTSGGLVIVDSRGQRTKLWTRVNGLPGTRIHALWREGDVLWVGTENGLARLSLGRPAALTVWPSRAVHAISRHRGTLYLGTWGGGLMRPQGRRLVAAVVDAPTVARRLRVTALHSAGAALYVGSAGAGLWRLEGRNLNRMAPLRRAHVWTLAQDPQGSLLAGTLGGLYLLLSRGAAFESRQIASTDARALAPLSSGRMMLGSYGSELGALAARGAIAPLEEWRTLGLQYVNDIEAEQGAVCVGTRGGAWIKRSAKADVEQLRFSGPASNDISALALDRDQLYVGTFDGGLSIYSGKSWRRVDGVDQRIDALALQPGADAQSTTLWVGTARGLYRSRGDELKRFGEADGLRRAHVHALAPLRDGGLLVGTARGAAIVRGDRVETIDVKSGLPVASVWAVAEHHDGTLWIGTTRGLYHWSRTRRRYRRFSVASGHLKEDWVTALALHRGQVYVGSYNAGVTRLARGAAGSWRSEHLGGGWVNFAGLTVERDTLFAASMSGLERLDLSKEGARFAPVRLRLPGRDVTGIAVARTGRWIATRRGLLWSEKGSGRPIGRACGTIPAVFGERHGTKHGARRPAANERYSLLSWARLCRSRTDVTSRTWKRLSDRGTREARRARQERS